jgi:hypothetical protein
MLRRSRGDRNAMWIEKYCLIPSGLDRGQRVRLTTEQKYLIRKIYDDGERVPVSAPLSAYLALLHVCVSKRSPVAHLCRSKRIFRSRSARSAETRGCSGDVPRTWHALSRRGMIAQNVRFRG